MNISLPTPDAVQILLTLGSVAVAWVSLKKVVTPTWRKLRRGWGKAKGIVQAIGGRDPIHDPITGKEIAPAVPPLGENLAAINDTMSKLVAVIESNQNAHERIDHVVTRVDGHDTAIAALLADKWENGANAALAAVKKQQQDTIDGEAD